MKCYDGKTILINKCNDYTSGLLTNYDTLISDLDLVKDYKIDGLYRYTNGNTYFEHATGINAKGFMEKYTKENPYLIGITESYSIAIYAYGGEGEDYRINATIVKNSDMQSIGGGFDTVCQEYVLGIEPWLLFTITNITYSELPRIIMSVDSDDITKITAFQLAFVIQNFNPVDKWKNICYNVSYYDYSGESKNLINELRGNATISEPISPNVPDIYGDYDNSSDNIDLPAIEDINIMSSIASDLVKAYQVDLANLNQLTSFLWSDSFIDTIKKLQNNPMENIQKLFYLPYNVEVSASENVKIGNTDSNIQGNRIVKQFQEIDFGNIDITEYYGNTLDYNTELSIYLPFIGEKTLNIYDIMGGSLNLKYRVDILTGNCIAILSIVRKQNDVTLNSVLYTYIGDMSNSVPLTSTQNNFFKQILGNLTNPTALITNSGVQFAMSGVSGVNATTYTHSGNIGGNNGFMSVLTPYLIIRRPVNVKPADYERTFGYPACTSVTLANQKGYCRYRECYFDNQFFDLEKDVCDEILNKLKTKGIFIK
jgi:hypothetical protein